MLIIELHALENGAHRNQTIDYLPEIPNGWAVVPEHLEAGAMRYLPFINLTVENGGIVGVSQGKIPPPVPNPNPGPSQEDRISALEAAMLAMMEV